MPRHVIDTFDALMLPPPCRRHEQATGWQAAPQRCLFIRRLRADRFATIDTMR